MFSKKVLFISLFVNIHVLDYLNDISCISSKLFFGVRCGVCEFFPQGFDEYMNLVLDDAEEIHMKSKTRRPLGMQACC